MSELVINLARNHFESQDVEVEDPPIRSRLLPGWEFWRVTDGNFPPKAIYVAVRDGVALLVEFEAGLKPIMQTMPSPISNKYNALELVNFFLLMARPQAEWLNTVEDVAGVDDQEREKWSAVIRPPEVTISDGAYLVEGHLWENGFVCRARFEIGPNGILSHLSEEEPLGVSIVIE